VSGVDELDGALLVTGFHYSIRETPEPAMSLFREFLVRAQGVRRDGSAALNLCYVACGRFDGFWETHLAPWDTAAGVLIVREAGGIVTRFDGGEFRLDGREILASGPQLHGAMREVIASRSAPS
jgi:myo-inositol-1(or 4)-monophosphatase